MSTRGCIARPPKRASQKISWVGVYNHSDSYPTSLGKILWDLMEIRYKWDARKLWAEIIDSHKAGWSSLNMNVKTWLGQVLELDRGNSAQYGFNLPIYFPREEGPKRGYAITSKKTDPLFIEWVYVIRPNAMDIYYSGRDRGSSRKPYLWKHFLYGTFFWDQGEPDWVSIEKGPEEPEAREVQILRPSVPLRTLDFFE